MKTLEEAVQKVVEAKPDQGVRVIRRMEVGSAVQQGDIYLHRLPDDVKTGKLLHRGRTQVALGDNMGARHMADGDIEVYEATSLPAGVRAPLNVSVSEIMGPVIKAKRPFSLTHPQHAHFRLPKGTYGVTYQYDPRTRRRGQD
jgi:hypothetical protein